MASHLGQDPSACTTQKTGEPVFSSKKFCHERPQVWVLLEMQKGLALQALPSSTAAAGRIFEQRQNHSESEESGVQPKTADPQGTEHKLHKNFQKQGAAAFEPTQHTKPTQVGPTK